MHDRHRPGRRAAPRLQRHRAVRLHAEPVPLPAERHQRRRPADRAAAAVDADRRDRGRRLRRDSRADPALRPR
ncbi:MAG: hypothetical protein MZW92_74040 [Comamonadaceae bacterium]|nr:hypothetical protein [Comamonadaceae bacterium]